MTQKEITSQLIRITHYTLRVCCLVFLASAISSPCIFAQGMGRMMGMGQGMRGNSQQSNNTPPPPKNTNPFAPDAPLVEGLEDRTTALEKFVFGSERKNLSMEQRVERLEKKLVPYEHHKSGDDLNERVDHLWSMLAAANKSPEQQ